MKCEKCKLEIGPEGWGRSWWVERDDPMTSLDTDHSTVPGRKKKVQLAEHKSGDCLKAALSKIEKYEELSETVMRFHDFYRHYGHISGDLLREMRDAVAEVRKEK